MSQIGDTPYVYVGQVNMFNKYDLGFRKRLIIKCLLLRNVQQLEKLNDAIEKKEFHFAIIAIFAYKWVRTK